MKNDRYGNHKTRRTLQREYCFEKVSRSGPNINPPKRNAAVTTAEIVAFLVAAYARAKVGAERINVIASWVFPLGIG